VMVGTGGRNVVLTVLSFRLDPTRVKQIPRVPSEVMVQRA